MEKRIEELDKNFKAQELKGGFLYRDVYACENVVIGGLWPGTYCRIDPAYLPKIPSEGVRSLAENTAGGTVRFKVRGRRFAVRMRITLAWDMSHMPRSGSNGLDIYVGKGKERYFYTGFRANSAADRLVEGEVILPEGEEEVLIHLPLYNGVEQLELGFPEGVSPEAPASYAYEKPIFYYGSSITQGGCASRPGNCYSAMISRMLDCGQWNLGFSGNGKGEQEVARWIAEQPMTAFVYDYDHNADSLEYLRATHRPFLETIWKGQPELPVLMVSKPDYFNRSGDWHLPPEENGLRRDTVMETYLWAKKEGYRVAFVDGHTLFDGPMARDCTVDGCHPNDLGFYRMAMKIAPVLERLLKEKR